MAQSRMNPALRAVLRFPTRLYGAGFGWLLGERFLMLTHVGRRSGRQYQTVVEVVGRDPGGDEYVVLSGFGRSADWLRNIQAGGGERVDVGRRSFRPVVRLLDVSSAADVFAAYEHRNRFVAPVVRFVLSRLLGWRYSGTPDERRRLVEQLPLVALRPADTSPGSVSPLGSV